MDKWRKLVSPVQWRRIHYRIWTAVVCLVLVFLLLKDSQLDSIPVVCALLLIILDTAGSIAFFRCPACRSILWRYRSGHCHSCGEFINLKNEKYRQNRK